MVVNVSLFSALQICVIYLSFMLHYVNGATVVGLDVNFLLNLFEVAEARTLMKRDLYPSALCWSFL